MSLVILVAPFLFHISLNYYKSDNKTLTIDSIIKGETLRVTATCVHTYYIYRSAPKPVAYKNRIVSKKYTFMFKKYSYICGQSASNYQIDALLCYKLPNDHNYGHA